MSEEDVNLEISPLGAEELELLRELVEVLRTNTEPWGFRRGGEEVEPGVIQMTWMQMSGLARQAMTWLYESGRLVSFRWSDWDDGREIFASWDDETAQSRDHLTVRKLLSAIARNDRFHDGAWVRLFEGGRGVPLFERLLECEEMLVKRARK